MAPAGDLLRALRAGPLANSDVRDRRKRPLSNLTAPLCVFMTSRDSCVSLLYRVILSKKIKALPFFQQWPAILPWVENGRIFSRMFVCSLVFFPLPGGPGRPGQLPFFSRNVAFFAPTGFPFLSEPTGMSLFPPIRGKGSFRPPSGERDVCLLFPQHLIFSYFPLTFPSFLLLRRELRSAPGRAGQASLEVFS